VAKKAKVTERAEKTPTKGRPKKVIKYSKTINVRLTQDHWVEVLSWAKRANLEPSVYIRKVLLDFLNIQHDILPPGAVKKK
jgi:hypothetical protein